MSWGGAVRFTGVEFANVTLEHGAVVSTSDNDFHDAAQQSVIFDPEDDAGYDVEVDQVAPQDAGMFGSEFRIEDAVMSDCLYMAVAPGSLTMPGCPPESAEQRERVRTRDPDYRAGELVKTAAPIAMGEAGIQAIQAALTATDEAWLSQTLQVRLWHIHVVFCPMHPFGANWKVLEMVLLVVCCCVCVALCSASDASAMQALLLSIAVLDVGSRHVFRDTAP